MIKIWLKRKTLVLFTQKKIIANITKEILEGENIKGKSEVNLILVSNKQMKKIMLLHNKEGDISDTLSFSNDWKKLSSFIGYNMLGDIYMNKSKIKKQAKKYNRTTKREWLYIFAHSLYHLLGYDHQTLESNKKMHQKVSATLKKMEVF